ncbi:MAG: hypothetical protein Q7T86_01845 [Hyphomicrobiaceae bacterium]|nr:hypothetical protein [Hyphomicrobiaceae bacterium]
MDAVYKLEVSPEDVKLIRAVIKAAAKEAQKQRLALDGKVMAKRLIRNYEDGERDFTRLKALILGAERAGADPGLRRAN